MKALIPKLFACTSALLIAGPAVVSASAASGPGWTTYGYTYENTRHASFSEINAHNAATLVPAWQFQTGQAGSFETSPIVVGDTMYITTGQNDTVIAIDARNGAQKWSYEPKLGFTSFCCGPENRGVAVDNGKVFVATLDGRLIALDAQKGTPVWDVQVGDPKEGFSETMAPLAWDGLVYVGSAGGEYGIRGSFTAYSEADGKLAWRWWSTSPGWEGSYVSKVNGVSLNRNLAQEKADAAKYKDAWQHGGGPVWMTPSLDTQRSTIYVATGNPAPQLVGNKRPGDNLYTDSIVALDAKTGKMKWANQETPHDIWDYDLTSPTVLFDALESSGKRVPAVAEASKTGWFNIINRDTGKTIRVSEPFVPQHHMYQLPGNTGALMEPGSTGGSNWSPVSYNPALHMAYISAVVQPRFDKPISNEEWKAGGERWAGSRMKVLPDVPASGRLVAMNVDTGKAVWSQKTSLPLIGGSLSVGDLVFVGEGNGMFDAFDAKSGALVWQYQTGAGIAAPPVAYEIGGREYIAVASGGSFVMNTNPGDSLLVFALPTHFKAGLTPMSASAEHSSGPAHEH